MAGITRRGFVRLAGAGAGLVGLAGLAGCGGSSSSPSDDSEEAVAFQDEAIRIGMAIWSSTDKLGALSVDIVRQAASALGAEVIVVDTAYEADQLVASIETFHAAGCAGVIACNSSDAEMAQVIEACDGHGMYLAQFFRAFTQEEAPEAWQRAVESDHFVGAVHEDEGQVAQRLMGALLAEGGPLGTGARHIGLVAWEEGDATFAERLVGYRAMVDAWNQSHPDDQATLADPVYAGVSAGEAARLVQQMADASPDLDAIVVAGGGGDVLEGVMGQLGRMGVQGQVSVVATDFVDETDDLLESGALLAAAGGQFADPLFAFLMAWQACQGKREVATDSFGPVLQVPMAYVTSAEDYQEFERTHLDQAFFSDDDIKAMANLGDGDLAVKAASWWDDPTLA